MDADLEDRYLAGGLPRSADPLPGRVTSAVQAPLELADPLTGTARLQVELHARGYRLTPQRQLVLEAVTQMGHATAEQVLVAVQQRAVAVNISTVYRTLYLLQEIGLVRHTHLGHGAPSFSLAGGHQHVHLVCRECAAVLELPLEVMGDLAVRLTEQHGFALDIGHTALFGICARCASAHPGPA